MNIVGLDSLESYIVEVVNHKPTHIDVLKNEVANALGRQPFDVFTSIENLIEKKLLVLNPDNRILTFKFPVDDNTGSNADFLKTISDLGKNFPNPLLAPSVLFPSGAPASNPYDPVNKPKGYNKGKISPADFIADQDLSFDRGSCVKYLCRAGVKEDPELSKEEKAIQDLKKAIWYLQHEIDWIKLNGLSR